MATITDEQKELCNTMQSIIPTISDSLLAVTDNFLVSGQGQSRKNNLVIMGSPGETWDESEKVKKVLSEKLVAVQDGGEKNSVHGAIYAWWCQTQTDRHQVFKAQRQTRGAAESKTLTRTKIYMSEDLQGCSSTEKNSFCGWELHATEEILHSWGMTNW